MSSQKTEQGVLIIVSAPSGCGKSTVVRRLMEKRENLRFSVSATTRKPRAGETDGVDYFFVSRKEFMRMVDDEEFLEHAEYVGNCYGTPRAPVERQLKEGFDVYLDIDVQGAMQVKAIRPETLMIFLMPPSMEELERRIRGRSTEPEEIVQQRLAKAARELTMVGHYKYVVCNDDVKLAADIIRVIIKRHMELDT